MLEGLFNSFTEDELAFINSDKTDRPKYKERFDRLNPFDLNSLRFTMVNRIYSKFLDRHIITLHDACAHANCQIQEWAKEDKSELRRAQNKRYHDKKKEAVEFDPDVLAAKQKWQKAILDKKNAITQWDEYIEVLLTEYLNTKLAKRSKA